MFQDEVAVSRRSFIHLAGVAAAGTSLAGLLAACGSTAAPAPSSVAPAGSPSTSGAAAGSTAAGGTSASPKASAGASGFPTYLADPNRPKPDFPSKGSLYEDGYINYPASVVKSISQPPGMGGNVTAFVQPLQPPPTPFDSNPAWKEVNKQLNANFQFNLIPVADYQTKLATLMAGGDLPDIINVFRGINGIANLPQFLQQACTDLSPYLAGDAIKDYPNLAAIPTFAWRNSGSVINGKVFMVPLERYAPGTLLTKNVNIYDSEIGKDYVPTSLDDYKRVLTQLNKPKEGRYATGAYQVQAGYWPFNVQFYTAALGGPNNWSVDSSGKLVKDFETQQYRDAVTYARDLYAAGLYHPNSLTNTSIKGGEDDMVSGRIAVFVTSFGNPWNDVWRQMLALKKNPTDVLPIAPFPAQAGGKPAHFLGLGFQSATAFKKASADRTKELLRILNYLAAPFGSAEDLLLTSGVKDTDYKLDDKGNPVLTDRGNLDANNVPWKYIVQRPQVMYLPDIANYAKILYDVEQSLIPIGVADPTLGYYSPTFTSKNVPIEKAFNDGLTEIITGRGPLSNYDQVLKDWQAGAGNQMRTEYMQAIAASQS